VTERFLGARKIGTTGRGIGPTYADKMNRIGIRVQDLFDEGILRQKVEAALAFKNQVLAKIYNTPLGRGRPRRRGAARRMPSGLLPWSATPPWCWRRRSTPGRTCCWRPARRRCSTSTTAPTRSSRRRQATAGGACTGSGIPPTRVSRVIAILKAYTTRVGEGPFPTELFDDDGETLRKVGAEYGTTTGRPRRCGWMDTVIGRYANRINGVTDFVITKLDVLTGFDKVPICVAYDVDGVRHDEMPVNQSDFHHAKPIYEVLPTAGGRTSRGAAPSRSCPRTRRPMCCGSRSSSALGCRRSGSARAGTRSSSATPCWTEPLRVQVGRRTCIRCAARVSTT
jgi:adenylosuccinate synthase